MKLLRNRVAIAVTLVLSVTTILLTSHSIAPARAEPPATRLTDKHSWDIAMGRTDMVENDRSHSSRTSDATLAMETLMRELPLDVYLRVPSLRERKPDLENVVAADPYLVGDQIFIRFVPAGDRQRQWAVNVDSIVALRYDLVRPVPPRMRDWAEAARSRLRTEDFDKQHKISASCAAACSLLSASRVKYYFSADDVGGGAAVLPPTHVTACFELGTNVFFRLAPVGDRGPDERWMINMSHVAAVELDERRN